MKALKIGTKVVTFLTNDANIDAKGRVPSREGVVIADHGPDEVVVDVDHAGCLADAKWRRTFKRADLTPVIA